MDSIIIQFVKPKDFDAVVEFSREHFLRDEPLNHALQSESKNSSSSVFDRRFLHTLEQGTSVMAVDRANGKKIVGVRVHRILKRNEAHIKDEEGSECIPATAASIINFVDFVSSQYDPWAQKGMNSLLSFQYMAVHRDYRGRNISSKMLEFTFDFMRHEKIPVAHVVATSAYSQAVFKKFKFELVHQIKYEDYKVDGKVVFHTEPPHTQCATFIKWI